MTVYRLMPTGYRGAFRLCGLLFLTLCFLWSARGEEVPERQGSAAAQPLLRTLRIGVEDTSYYPWSMPDGSGVDLLLARAVAQEMQLAVDFKILPWPQCLADLLAGKLDAVLNASYSPERAKLFAYPLKDGVVDENCRTHIDGYSLYRRKGGTAVWLNGKLEHCSSPVAVQRGFSVGEILKVGGARLDERHQAPEDILALMQQGKIEAAALLHTNTDRLLELHSEWAATVEKAPFCIVSKPYYLIFNKELSEHEPEMTRAFWKRLAALRNSPRYGRLIAQIYAHTQAQPPATPLPAAQKE